MLVVHSRANIQIILKYFLVTIKINDAKIRKERDDCLEGIDLSNIIKSKLRKTTKVEAPVVIEIYF